MSLAVQLAVLLAACSAPGAAGSDAARPAAAKAGASAVPALELPPRWTGAAAPGTGAAGAAAAPGADVRDLASELAVARVAGRSIDARELLAAWFHNESQIAAGYVDKLVVSELVALDGARLGIELEPEAVEAALCDARAQIERLVTAGAGGWPTLEAYVQGELGQDPAQYLARLRGDCATKLLADRVVRAWILGQERAVARAIACATEANCRAALARVEAGESFAAVAAELSLDESSARGGLLAPLARASDSALARLAFESTPGQLAGPFEQGGRWIAMWVERVEPALAGDWDAIRGDVERSLADAPVEPGEFLQWRASVERRYGVDRSPFLRLVGAAGSARP